METDPTLVAVAAAAERVAAGDREALERLVDVLTGLDAGGDEDLGRRAVGVLSQVPKAVARLDEHARQVLWCSSYHSPVLTGLAARLHRPVAGPVAVAVTSTHGDGRVRERAVEAMLASPCPELLPFLVLRTSDWVRQVRDRARAGLALLLADEPATYLPAALPTVLLLGARSRGGFAANQVTAALLAAPPDIRRALAVSSHTAQRRLVFDVGLAHSWLRIDDLVAAAEADADVRIRVRAVEAACREAVWTGRAPILHRLARSVRSEVRVVALTGLLRLGHHADVTTWLDDDAPLVRAVAREAARRAGTDAGAHYRAAVTGAAPTPGAIAGLAETASTADAPLLHGLLAHPDPRIRAAAVRALRHLGVAAHAAERIMPLLRDPSPSVVREAATALRPVAGRLPPALPWQLLADPRVELRRAGYRLFGTRPALPRLRAGLILSVDADPRLAGRGRADVTRLARDASRTSWSRTPAPRLDATAEQRDELATLIRRAAPALGGDVTGLLTAWLERT